MLAVVFVDAIVFTFLGKDPRLLLAKAIIHVSFILWSDLNMQFERPKVNVDQLFLH